MDHLFVAAWGCIVIANVWIAAGGPMAWYGLAWLGVAAACLILRRWP